MAHILIVEDEQSDRVILANILEGRGHQVYFASDGEQALKIFLARIIEIVVTDLQMPHVDGLELIMELRALRPQVRVIVVSGKAPEMLAEAKSNGVLETLSKPVDPHALLEAVTRAASNDRASAQRDPQAAGPELL